jgi:hypothetical protein
LIKNVLQDEIAIACNSFSESFIVEYFLAPRRELLHVPKALSSKLEVGPADLLVLLVISLVFFSKVSSSLSLNSIFIVLDLA